MELPKAYDKFNLKSASTESIIEWVIDGARAWQVLDEVALEQSSKSTKNELEGSYDDLVHELSWTDHTPFFVWVAMVMMRKRAFANRVINRSDLSRLIVPMWGSKMA